jgi:hypothetical protein
MQAVEELSDIQDTEAGSRVWGGGPAPRRALIVPSRSEDLRPHYDVAISQPSPDQVHFQAFNRWLAEEAGRRSLSCAVIHDGVVQEALRRLATGALTVGYHLDYFALWHVTDDRFARLSQAVQDAGGRPVNAPARARLFTDKAAAHEELLRRDFGVPATVLLRPWVPDRPLTAAERARLGLDEPGARAYVKPANGFSGRGLVRADRTDPEGIATAIRAARDGDRNDSYLVQRAVRPPRLMCDDGAERPAYWRVLYCLGELMPFWWGPADTAPGGVSYRRVTTAEVRRLGLDPVLDYAAGLAELCGLDWFSTELCLGDGGEPSRYVVRPAALGKAFPVVAIDYVNDQCDVDVRSRWPGAPPDDVVRHVAGRFAEEAWRLRQRTAGEVIALRVAA